MEEQIFNMFLKEGGYALLFVWMLFSTMKNNKERETKYQQVIEKNQSVIERTSKGILFYIKRMLLKLNKF
jgi:hypothetical protein